MFLHRLPSIALALTVFATINAFPQESDHPIETARLMDTLPTIDGNVLDDPAWRGAVSISDFTQWVPTNGAPATRKTEVYFGYSDEYLLVGAICHEHSQEDIVVSSDGFQSDSFTFVIDTFLNGQNGFTFGTNPIGAQYDGSITNNSIDWNWSTSWKVRVRQIEQGWSAEFQIPFNSLRYGSEPIQTWGLNFERFTVKNNEVSSWAPIPPQFSLSRLDLAGQISQIKVPAHRRNLKLTPYLVIGRERTEYLNETTKAEENDVGFDLKYSLTNSLTLDATYNTDFAQVESDQLQINLGRFDLFFPETRPFFLENAGLFKVGGAGVHLFHSRTIGIEPDGRKLPLKGGARVTGKLGSNRNLGLLFMRAEGGEYVPQNDFLVARYSHELPNRSSTGLIVIGRKDDETDHQTFGIDAKLGIGSRSDSWFYAATTNSEGISEDTHSFGAHTNYSDGVWHFNIGYSEVGKGFNPEVGFVSRTDYRFLGGGLTHTTSFDESSKFKEWNQVMFADAFWDFDGYMESSYLHLETWLLWKNGADIWPVFNIVTEGVKEDFYVADVLIPAGDYESIQYQLNAQTPTTRPLRGGIGLVQGGFYNGDLLNASLFVGYRRENRWNMFASYNHNRIDLPTKDSAFSLDLSRFGVTYTFSAKASLGTLIQYNGADDVFAANVRFSWLRTSNTGFFLVYNEFDDRGNIPGPNRKELVVKYTHVFDVL